MQRVGVVDMSQPQSVRHDLVAQRVGAVDADVSTLVGVVLVGQCPAHPLRQPAGNRDCQGATWFENTDEFCNGRVVLRDMLEDLRRDHTLETAVGVGQVEGVALDHLGPRRCGHLTLVLHRLQDLVDVVEVGGILVERDDVGPTAVGLEGMPACAAAHIDHLGAGADVQPIEVDGQHCAT